METTDNQHFEFTFARLAVVPRQIVELALWGHDGTRVFAYDEDGQQRVNAPYTNETRFIEGQDGFLYGVARRFKVSETTLLNEQSGFGFGASTIETLRLGRMANYLASPDGFLWQRSQDTLAGRLAGSTGAFTTHFFPTISYTQLQMTASHALCPGMPSGNVWAYISASTARRRILDATALPDGRWIALQGLRLEESPFITSDLTSPGNPVCPSSAGIGTGDPNNLTPGIGLRTAKAWGSNWWSGLPWATLTNEGTTDIVGQYWFWFAFLGFTGGEFESAPTYSSRFAALMNQADTLRIPTLIVDDRDEIGTAPPTFPGEEYPARQRPLQDVIQIVADRTHLYAMMRGGRFPRVVVSGQHPEAGWTTHGIFRTPIPAQGQAPSEWTRIIEEPSNDDKGRAWAEIAVTRRRLWVTEFEGVRTPIPGQNPNDVNNSTARRRLVMYDKNGTGRRVVRSDVVNYSAAQGQTAGLIPLQYNISPAWKARWR